MDSAQPSYVLSRLSDVWWVLECECVVWAACGEIGDQSLVSGRGSQWSDRGCDIVTIICRLRIKSYVSVILKVFSCIYVFCNKGAKLCWFHKLKCYSWHLKYKFQFLGSSLISRSSVLTFVLRSSHLTCEAEILFTLHSPLTSPEFQESTGRKFVTMFQLSSLPLE